MTAQLILASSSPRRRELLKQLGLNYSIHAVDIDESVREGESPITYVKRIAAEKSAACVAQLNPKLPVLSADTAVILNNHIMGKPENQQHAKQMLQQLSGQTHQVYSAISLRNSTDSHLEAVNITEVKFRKITQTEMDAYWQTGEPQDKAGGYAIQGLASIFIESINGSFSGVMGLPLFETAQLLAKQGITVISDE